MMNCTNNTQSLYININMNMHIHITYYTNNITTPFNQSQMQLNHPPEPKRLHFRLALQTVPRRRRCSACAAGAGLIRRRRRIGRVVLAVVVLGVGGGHYLRAADIFQGMMWKIWEETSKK